MEPHMFVTRLVPNLYLLVKFRVLLTVTYYKTSRNNQNSIFLA